MNVGLREIISGNTNSDGDYDDVYLPQNVGVVGEPATDPIIEKFAGAVFVLFAGALAFRLWRAKGPGRRKLRREREAR